MSDPFLRSCCSADYSLFFSTLRAGYSLEVAEPARMEPPQVRQGKLLVVELPLEQFGKDELQPWFVCIFLTAYHVLYGMLLELDLRVRKAEKKRTTMSRLDWSDCRNRFWWLRKFLLGGYCRCIRRLNARRGHLLLRGF